MKYSETKVRNQITILHPTTKEPLTLHFDRQGMCLFAKDMNLTSYFSWWQKTFLANIPVTKEVFKTTKEFWKTKETKITRGTKDFRFRIWTIRCHSKARILRTNIKDKDLIFQHNCILTLSNSQWIKQFSGKLPNHFRPCRLREKLASAQFLNNGDCAFKLSVENTCPITNTTLEKWLIVNTEKVKQLFVEKNKAKVLESITKQQLNHIKGIVTSNAKFFQFDAMDIMAL